MLLLVTDTSGRNGSVSLARAGEDGAPHEAKLIDSVPLAGGTFSAQLVPQIAAVLQKHGLQKHQIDAFVVVSGPGSFTGLRVGLAAIKALAEIFHKPIVPVSLLELLAVGADRQGLVLAVLDAGRSQLYSGEYNISSGKARVIREQLIARDELARYAASMSVCTPDTVIAEQAREAHLNVIEVDSVTPAMIANLGWRKLKAGEVVSPEQLDANYVRRSDEIFAKPVASS